MKKLFLGILIGSTCVVQAQITHGPAAPLQVSYSECLPAYLIEANWTQYAYDQRSFSNSLRCSKVTPLNIKPNAWAKAWGIQLGQPLPVDDVFIGHSNYDPGLRSVIKTENFQEFCDSIKNSFLDWCANGLLGQVDVIQNHVPFSPSIIFRHEETLELVINQGYGNYNLAAIEDTLFGDNEYSQIQRLNITKEANIPGVFYLLPNAYHSAQSNKQVYNINAGHYRFVLEQEDDQYSNIYAIDNISPETNIGTAIRTAVVLGDLFVIVYASATTEHMNTSEKIVNFYDPTRSGTAFKFNNSWPSWWPWKTPEKQEEVLPSENPAIEPGDDDPTKLRKALNNPTLLENRQWLEKMLVDCVKSHMNKDICETIVKTLRSVNSNLAFEKLRQATSNNNIENWLIQEREKYQRGESEFTNEISSLIESAYYSQNTLIVSNLDRNEFPYKVKFIAMDLGNNKTMVFLFKQRLQYHSDMFAELSKAWGFNVDSFIGAGYVNRYHNSDGNIEIQYDSSSMRDTYGKEKPENATRFTNLNNDMANAIRSYFGQ